MCISKPAPADSPETGQAVPVAAEATLVTSFWVGGSNVLSLT